MSERRPRKYEELLPIEGERWAPIDGFSHYDISDHGRARSWRPGPNAKGDRRSKPINIKGGIANGRRTLCLMDGPRGSRRHRWFILSRLVALAFVEGDRSLEVAHLDGNPLNNHYTNLKWCTSRENNSHKFIHGTIQHGETHSAAIRDDRTVRAIIRLFEGGMAIPDIAWIFETKREVVRDYIDGRCRHSATGRRSIRMELRQYDKGAS